LSPPPPPVQFADLVFQAVGHIVIPGGFRLQAVAIEIGDAALDFFNPVGPVGIRHGGTPVASIRPAYQRSETGRVARRFSSRAHESWPTERKVSRRLDHQYPVRATN